jgi:serine/threonine-protein kinase RsbT
LPVAVVKDEQFGLQSDIDVVTARQAVRDWAKEIGLSVLDLTKVVTAASELARNTVVYGGGGSMSLAIVRDGGRQGLRLTFEDRGPGIPDVERAMQDGFTTGHGMGMGLPGARRLVDEFALTTSPECGTSVTILRWKP